MVGGWGFETPPGWSADGVWRPLRDENSGSGWGPGLNGTPQSLERAIFL